MENCDDAELAALIKQQAGRYRAPSGLQQRIAADLAQATAAPRTVMPAPSVWQRWFGMGAAFAAGIAMAVALSLFFGSQGGQDRLVQQVVDSHVRSLMVAHLSDVASSDQHTVKPWFDGKLDFAPPVQDLAAAGFPLAGGRLDYLAERPVAALIYRHRLHVINLFIWPASGPSPFVAVSTVRQGYNVKSWQDDGMQFWLVSDVQAADLASFEKLLRGKSG
ncbi:MAG TPA: hypothetical protein VI279_13130 [Rhodocyclaceae bacterium]